MAALTEPLPLPEVVNRWLADNIPNFGTFTPTSGQILIGDGDSWESVAVSGDATLASDGTLDVTDFEISDRSVFIGGDAGAANTTGDENVFIGDDAGAANTTGVRNVFVGEDAGKTNTTGSRNVFVGEDAGKTNTEGSDNVFIGENAGANNTTGERNFFLGEDAGRANTTGTRNIFIGENAGEENTTGTRNIFIGRGAGETTTTGSENILFGSDMDCQSSTGSNQLSIANLILSDDHGANTGTTLSTGNVGIGVASPTASLHTHGAIRPATYTVASAPTASSEGAGAIIYVSNGAAGSPVLAFSDGTNWLRVDTLAAISST